MLNAALVDIDKRLQNQGKSLVDFPGPPTSIRIKSPYEEALIIQRELDYNVGEQLVIVAQLTVFTSIMAAVDDSEHYPKMFL